jgi:hypothetical protein
VANGGMELCISLDRLFVKGIATVCENSSSV